MGDGAVRPGNGHEQLALDGPVGLCLPRGFRSRLDGHRSPARRAPQLETVRAAAAGGDREVQRRADKDRKTGSSA